MSRRRHAVVLQVHLDAFAVFGQQVEQCVIRCDPDPVGVDQDPGDRSSDQLGQQLAEARVQGRLAAAEHEHVEAAVLPASR